MLQVIVKILPYHLLLFLSVTQDHNQFDAPTMDPTDTLFFHVIYFADLVRIGNPYKTMGQLPATNVTPGAMNAAHTTPTQPTQQY
jgi:hypothetical protein